MDKDTRCHSTGHDDNRDGARAGNDSHYTADTTTMTHAEDRWEIAYGVVRL